MSEPINDGGPVFSTSQFYSMSLRDYLAAQALQGAIACGALTRIATEIRAERADMTLSGVARVTNRLLAENCYEIADTMIAARNAAPPTGETKP